MPTPSTFFHGRALAPCLLFALAASAGGPNETTSAPAPAPAPTPAPKPAPGAAAAAPKPAAPVRKPVQRSATAHVLMSPTPESAPLVYDLVLPELEAGRDRSCTVSAAEPQRTRAYGVVEGKSAAALAPALQDTKGAPMPAAADTKAAAPMPVAAKVFDAIHVQGRSMPMPGLGRRLIVGYNMEVTFAWPPSQDTQVFHWGEPWAWLRKDVSNLEMASLHPTLAETTCCLNSTVGEALRLSAMEASDRLAVLHARGVLPLAGRTQAVQAEPRDGIRGGAHFLAPLGLATMMDSRDLPVCLVTDAGSHAIRTIDLCGSDRSRKGETRTPWGHPTGKGHLDGVGKAARFNGPTYLCPDPAAPDGFLVSDSGNHVVRAVVADRVFTLAGVPGNAGHADAPDPAQALFSNPQGVAMDDKGNAYVADQGNFVIRRIDPDMAVTTLAGVPGQSGAKDGKAEEARFTDLSGLTVVGGKLFVLDGHAVRRVDLATGEVKTLCGKVDEPGFLVWWDGTSPLGLAGVPCLNQPRGIATHEGALYVADTGSHSLRRIDLGTGRQWTVVGDPEASHLKWGLCRDGAPHPEGLASLHAPQGLAINAAGHAYLASGAGVCEIPVLAGKELAQGAVHDFRVDAAAQSGKPLAASFTWTAGGPASKVEMAYVVRFFNAEGGLEHEARGHCFPGVRQEVSGTIGKAGKGSVTFQGMTQQGVGVFATAGALPVQVN